MNLLRQFTLVSFLSFLCTACDVDQGPLVAASEKFERGVALFEQKSFRQAETAFTQAIFIYEQEKQYPNLAEAYAYLAQINLALGQFRAGIEQAKTAIEYSKRANDFRGEARLDLLLGDAYRIMGLYRNALSSYDASLSLSTTFADRSAKAEAEMKKASSLYWMGQWDEALKNYESALTQYRSAGQDNDIAAALIGIGEVYARQRRYGEALSSLTQASQSLDEGERPELDGRLAIGLGNVHRAMNDPNAALKYFRDGANRLRARKTGRDPEALLLFYIGTIYNEGSRFEDSKKFYTDAAAVARNAGDRIAENYLYLFIAQATERQIAKNQKGFQLDQRVRSYRQIAEKFRECGHATGEAYAYVQAGTLYQSVGRLAEAREMLQRAVELEENRMVEYIDPELHLPYQIELGIEGDREEWSERLADVLIQIKRPDEALLVLDKARAKAYFDMLARTGMTARQAMLRTDMENVKEKIRELGLLQLELSRVLASRQATTSPQEINQLRSRGARMNDEIMRIAARVSATHPNYGPLMKYYGMKMAEIQSSIPVGTLLISYLPSESQLYIFALSKSGFTVRSVPVSRERLLAMTEEYQRLLGDPNVYAGAAGEASLPAMTRFATLSTQLYDLLLLPVDPLFDRHLVIVAGREFENFPFHAVEKQERNGTVRYLIELTSVDYLASLSSLRFRTSNAGQIRDVVAIGNPTGKNWSVDYELRDIRSFFKEANILVGFEATWSALKSARADVLQIASDFRNDEPAAPCGSVALSDGETYEQSIDLPFEDLTQLPPSPVMVLSNTYGQGSGFKPIHAFVLRMNGTSDVFFNAWGADRKAAKFFSEFFYTHLSSGLAPGDAYRQALLNLIRTSDLNHPHAWGQFFHYGIG